MKLNISNNFEEIVYISHYWCIIVNIFLLYMFLDVLFVGVFVLLNVVVTYISLYEFKNKNKYIKS